MLIRGKPSCQTRLTHLVDPDSASFGGELPDTQKRKLSRHHQLSVHHQEGKCLCGRYSAGSCFGTKRHLNRLYKASFGSSPDLRHIASQLQKPGSADPSLHVVYLILAVKPFTAIADDLLIYTEEEIAVRRTGPVFHFEVDAWG